MAEHSSAVIFDLDDTLIDTRGVLLPAALQRVAEATGLDIARLNPRGKSIDEVLAGIEGLLAARRAAAARAWYAPEAVPPLEPLPGAREALAALRGRAFLFLVTRGHPPRQRRKLERCGLGPIFDEVRIRDIEEPGTKRDDFVALLEAHGLAASRCAVVGDDPEDELRHAADLGCHVLRVPDVALTGLVSILERLGLLEAGPGRARGR